MLSGHDRSNTNPDLTNFTGQLSCWFRGAQSDLFLLRYEWDNVEA